MYHLWSSPAPVRHSATWKETLGDALRLAVWRTPRYAEARMSGLAITVLFAIVALACVATELVIADGALDRFSPYGLNALLAALAVNAGVVLAFSHIDNSQATTRRLLLVYGWIVLAGVCENLLLHWLAPNYSGGRGLTPAAIAIMAVGPITYIWLAGAARRAFTSTPGVRRPTLRGVAFILTVALSTYVTPEWPVFAPQNFDRATANLWELYKSGAYARQAYDEQAARRAAESSAARLEAVQGLRLANAFDKLAPRDPSQANVFTLGVAGWSDQDVFLNEIRQSTEILKTRFHLGDRTLTLINNWRSTGDTPIASVSNLGAALREISQRMDRDNDLLVLVLSSHGSPDGFGLDFDDVFSRTLDPATLREMLDAAKIKNRVVIVSSCYAGTFVAPLRNPDTMILTAADADHTSFGCADDRKWTWFGEALFEKALADNTTLADAFASAKATVANWEREDKLTASNPQIFVGHAIAKRFPDIVGKPPTSREAQAE